MAAAVDSLVRKLSLRVRDVTLQLSPAASLAGAAAPAAGSGACGAVVHIHEVIFRDATATDTASGGKGGFTPFPEHSAHQLFTDVWSSLFSVQHRLSAPALFLSEACCCRVVSRPSWRRCGGIRSTVSGDQYLLHFCLPRDIAGALSTSRHNHRRALLHCAGTTHAARLKVLGPRVTALSTLAQKNEDTSLRVDFFMIAAPDSDPSSDFRDDCRRRGTAGVGLCPQRRARHRQGIQRPAAAVRHHVRWRAA